MVKIIECPRDAMQGMENFIDTSIKAAYINQLLEVGFDTIDFGSFVSPKAIPQMRDTAEVLDLLDLYQSKSKLLAIVANLRGAQDALQFDPVDYLGFPLSVSEIFQKRNTNQSISEALELIDEIQNLSEIKGKKLVIYLSMAFGNPYQEAYDPDLVAELVAKLAKKGINTVSYSDTIGIALPENIRQICEGHLSDFNGMEFGVHLHSRPDTAGKKIEAAVSAGCRRFDSAIAGHGGCPMAMDEMVGNLATETLLQVLEEKGFELNLNKEALMEAQKLAKVIF